jgi:hypothetical protein
MRLAVFRLSILGDLCAAEKLIAQTLTEAVCYEFGLDEIDMVINVKPTVRVPCR